MRKCLSYKISGKSLHCVTTLPMQSAMFCLFTLVVPEMKRLARDGS